MRSRKKSYVDPLYNILIRLAKNVVVLYQDSKYNTKPEPPGLVEIFSEFPFNKILIVILNTFTGDKRIEIKFIVSSTPLNLESCFIWTPSSCSGAGMMAGGLNISIIVHHEHASRAASLYYNITWTTSPPLSAPGPTVTTESSLSQSCIPASNIHQH